MESEINDQIDIHVIPFQPCYQEEVVKLFRRGLSAKTYNLGDSVIRQQKWFVSSKLSKFDGGDMFNIWESFMQKNINTDHATDKEQWHNITCRNFWVAIDRSEKKVIGHVGVVMSMYEEEDKTIYHTNDLNPSNVCEVIRMGVQEDYRRRNVGTMLLNTVEEYALNKGMKQIVLSTLDRMTPARRFYEHFGFKLVKETKFPMKETLGPGEWEDLYIVHYIKPIKAR